MKEAREGPDVLLSDSVAILHKNRSRLVWSIMALWFFMVSVTSLSNLSVAVLQAVMVLSFPWLSRFPGGRGISLVWMLWGVSFVLSNFLLYIERESLLSWPRGFVYLAHLMLLLLQAGLVDKAFAVRGLAGKLVRYAAAASVFLVCYLNVESIFLNQWHVAVVEVFFVLSVVIFYFSPFRVGRLGWVFFLFFLTSIVVSNTLSTISGVGGGDWYRGAEVVAHLLLLLAMISWFLRDERSVQVLLATVAAATIVYLFVLMFYWSVLPDPRTYNWAGSPPFFRNIRHLGYLLCISMVVSSWGVFAYGGRLKVVALVTLVLSASMLLWSGGRGGFVAACLGTLSLLLVFHGRPYAREWRWVVMAVLASFMLSSLFPVESGSMGWLTALLRTGGADSSNQLSSGRLEIWRSLLPHISERMWFGWGGEGFLAVRESRSFVQAHNGLLQLLLEWGVVGTALCVLALSRVLFVAVQQVVRKVQPAQALRHQALGISMMCALLALSLVDGVFYHGLTLFFMMIAVALLLASESACLSSGNAVSLEIDSRGRQC
ncbi:O-antigen ligase family protein [Metapseudomonas furukawaii]|nr:O-antigen ligase family protein [Pseudomonas furukawaii]